MRRVNDEPARYLPYLRRLASERRGEEAAGQSTDERPAVNHSIT